MEVYLAVRLTSGQQLGHAGGAISSILFLCAETVLGLATPSKSRPKGQCPCHHPQMLPYHTRKDGAHTEAWAYRVLPSCLVRWIFSILFKKQEKTYSRG